MQKTYIAIIVLVIIAAGAWFFLGMNKNVEAPVVEEPVSTHYLPNDTQQTQVNNNNNQPTPAPAPQPVKEFTITGQNFSFTPSAISVKKGDKVKITFKNVSGFHDFRLDAFGVATKQAQGPSQEVVQFTADKTGTFEYYCSVGTHRMMGMKGTLTVQ